MQIFGNLRASLESKCKLKISFRKKCKNAYTGLCRALLKLGKADEALYEAEKGREQILKKLMEYGTGWLHSESPDPKDKMSRILSGMTTPTLFATLGKERINLWLLKGKEIHCEKRRTDKIPSLMKKASKEIRYVFKCDNR